MSSGGAFPLVNWRRIRACDHRSAARRPTASWGAPVRCVVEAPSKIVRTAGARIKADTKDNLGIDRTILFLNAVHPMELVNNDKGQSDLPEVAR